MIQLTSDTASAPTPAMRDAMAGAVVGDEQAGTDPTVNRLQERVADMLGKEAALWFPTGTMCNLVAIKVHTRPGDAVIAETMAHVIRAESAGTPIVSGVLIEPVGGERGAFGPDGLKAAIARLHSVPEPYGPPIRLVCVEQTHNFAGGAVLPLATLRALAEAARVWGIALHMDGARLMNAVVASGVAAKDYAATVDSLWLDFTKGLGCPIGAVLAGDRPFIKEARRFKQAFGGAMRQAGIAAAACLHALDHHVERLADDHANAARLAAGLEALPGLRLVGGTPETNIVYFDASAAPIGNAGFVAGLARRGVALGVVNHAVRAVTHLDVSIADVDRAIEAAGEVLRAG